MKLTLLLFLLIPALLPAQEVQPVISSDYLELLQKNKRPATAGDTVPRRLQDSAKQLKGVYQGGPASKIIIKGNTFTIKPWRERTLFIGGNLSSTVEWKESNGGPRLQNTYAQGRPAGGQATWRGPETGELFSYGPAISTLEYDGSPYPYDQNGRLTTKGNGNGQAANSYNNNITRAGFLFSQQGLLQARLWRAGKKDWTFKLNGGRTGEQTLVQHNRNTKTNILGSVSGTIAGLTVTGRQNYRNSYFSNGNRNGFLNRTYQDALLTPATFSNRQGYLLGNGQRSYADSANNPYFLLKNNNNRYTDSYAHTGLTIEKRAGSWRIKMQQSLEQGHQLNAEVWMPGNAFFKDGTGTTRRQHDRSWFTSINIERDIRSYDDSRSSVSFNYMYNDILSRIQYSFPGTQYRYQRSGHDAVISYQRTYDKGNKDFGFNAANKIYLSNTTAKKSWWLPALGAFIIFENAAGLDRVNLKLASSYTSFASEPSVTRSWAGNNLLRQPAAQAGAYFPVQEAATFNGLLPVKHDEWKALVEIQHRYNMTLSAELFSRNTRNDIYPVFESGLLQLKNIVSHRQSGVELQFNIASNAFGANNNYKFNSGLYFTAYRNKVTRIAAGYDNTPVAGLGHVYRALVKGKAPGVIMGNSWLRDANNNRVIGADGFPLVNNQPVVLGDPNPDFIMKWTQGLKWKKLSLNIDWEWVKGGDRWNGTRAVLDYFGRSQQTAGERDIRGYVFSGVLENGQPNTKPVDFYNPALPLQQNLWVRYGYTGVAENYMEKAGALRIRNISLSWPLMFKKNIHSIVFTGYVSNLLVAAAYKGADPNQFLFDDAGNYGLDFFNLPSTKNIGLNITIQF